MKAPEHSKFDYGEFRDGYDDFAVNSAKYTVEEAIALYVEEMGAEPGDILSVCNAFVSHHAGVNEDYEPVVGWWLEYRERKSSCPVYAMHMSWGHTIPLYGYTDYEVRGVTADE